VSRRGLFVAAAFVLFSLQLIVASIRQAGGDGTIPPPHGGDAQQYDNLAMQLMRGRGFGVDYTDREWRKPYEQHNANGEFNALLAHREGFQPNTFRPPLLPVVVAIVYRIFGRDFLIWRIVESLFTAAALALICNVAWREFGPRASMITFLLLLLSGTYTPFVAYQWLLTEPLAIAMTACMVWTLSTVKGSHRTAMALLCGVFFALLCLTRSFYVVWLPALAVIVWWMGRRRAAAVFVAAAVLVQLPWWIRNCRVTDSFMPFGTQGGVALYTGYSDDAMVHGGRWWIDWHHKGESAYVRETGRTCVGCSEPELARYTSRGARVWALAHLGDLPRLAWWKVEDTLSHTPPVLWLGLAAPFVAWHRRIAFAAVLGCLLVLNIAVIALTWSQQWRFMVPVEPLLAMLAALPLTSAVFGETTIAPPRETSS